MSTSNLKYALKLLIIIMIMAVSCSKDEEPVPEPIASFTTSATSIKEGENVTFTNTSKNEETVLWTFVGGSPSTSTSDTPTVRYLTPGKFDVVLTVTNASGSDIEQKTGLITVEALDKEGPTVTNINPASNATNVDVNTNITITFSEAVDINSVNNTSVILSGGAVNSVAANVTVASNIMTIDPNDDLTPGLEYTLRLIGIKDLKGNPMSATYSSKFTTKSTLASLSTPSASNVSVSSANISSSVTDSGSGSVTERGFVWSKSTSPTTASGNKKSVGTGAGPFEAVLTDLDEGTKYFIRSYAISNAGTAYSAEINITTKSYTNLSIDFDGNDDFVEIPDNNSLDLTSAYTIEAWINIRQYSSFGGIVSKWQNVGGQGYMLRLSPDAPYDEISFDGMKTDGLNLKLNQWYHVAAVNQNGTRSLYINGSKVPLTGNADFVNPQSNDNPLKIGVDYSSRFFNGKIDEVRIWNVARTAAQIDDNWDKNLTGSESGLVGYYPMKADASSAASNGGKVQLVDLSSKGNNGELINFSLSGATSNWNSNYIKPTFTIGEDYLGGKIAYLDASGRHGFIIYPSNADDNRWFTGTNKDIDTGNLIGDGPSNTSKIVQAYTGPFCGSFTSCTAAGTASNKLFRGFSDWYLPSINELKEVHKNRVALGGFAEGYYWSSSQYTIDNALIISFFEGGDAGTVYQDPKANSHKIRPIRSF